MAVNFVNEPIVGVTFRLSFDELKALPELQNIVDVELAVAQDFHNHYDPNAIAVYMQILDKVTKVPQGKPRHIGYIAKTRAQEIAKSGDTIDATKRYNLNVKTTDFTGKSDTWLSIGDERNSEPVAQPSTDDVFASWPTNPFA